MFRKRKECVIIISTTMSTNKSLVFTADYFWKYGVNKNWYRSKSYCINIVTNQMDFFQNYSSLSKIKFYCKVFTFMRIYSCSCLFLGITRQMIRLLALILNMRFKVKQTTRVESLRKADWWLACNPRISRWIAKFLCLFWMYKCIRKTFNAV